MAGDETGDQAAEQPGDQAGGAHDPYRNFRFRLTWQGRVVAGVSQVSGLTRTTQVITHRTGGDPAPPRQLPGQIEFGPIMLERGVTQDAAFIQWINTVWDYPNAANPPADTLSLADFRHDIGLELYNEAEQLVLTYTLRRCWPSAFVGLADLDGLGNAVAIQSLALQNEGWERVVGVG